MYWLNKFSFSVKTFSLNMKLVSRRIQSTKLSNSKKNYKKALYQGGEYAALLMVLSKAFGCLPHEIVVTKLHAYGFCKASLRLIAI